MCVIRPDVRLARLIYDVVSPAETSGWLGRDVTVAERTNL